MGGTQLVKPKDALELDQEVAALDAAPQLAARDPVGALKALDEYRRRFPRGDLAPEAAVLRIQALEGAGQHDAAERMARDFLAHDPDSPHAKKIRTMFG
jgi:outer membrane protein assembly factor BamD (BamD/ComL family)